MISQKTRYALKALVLLAAHEKLNAEPVLISELARRGKMPQKFLEAILLELKNGGLLQSKKGKGGGYFLAKKPEAIKLGSVIRMLEGPLALIPCVSQNLPHKCDECDDEATFGLRILFKEVRDATAGILDNTSLAKVRYVQDIAKNNKKAMYFI